MRASVLVALSGLAACGRGNFDAITDGGLGSETGENGDGGSATCTPTTEVCNGVDDNCDGEIDEGCPCTAFDVNVPAPVMNDCPGFVWTGSGFFVVYYDGTNRSIQHFSAIGAAGALHSLGSATTTSLPVGHDSLAWSGTRLAAGTTTNTAVSINFFDENLVPLGSPTVLPTPGYGAHIVWTGDRFGVVWASSPLNQLYLVELDGNGVPLGPEIPLPPTNVDIGVITATPTGYLIPYRDGSTPHLLVWERATGVTADLLPDLAPQGAYIATAAGAGGYVVFEAGVPVGTSKLQMLDASGQLVGSSIATPTLGMAPSYTAIVATPTDFRLIGNAGSGTQTIYEAGLDATGAITSAPTSVLVLSNVNGYSAHSAVSASGRHAFVLAYGDVSSKLRLIQRCE
ncbi:MAG TPA: putative metal-binding motif-containing protein [Kofleriaceae bacterium]